MFSAIIFDCDGVLVDSEILALEVELILLREHGLEFERVDYVTRFIGLSYDAFHVAMDAEAQKRLGHALPGNIREELATRLRDAMIARLVQVPGAGAAVATVTLPKAIASSSTRAGLERKLKQVGLWDSFAPHVYSAEDVVHAKPAPDLFLHAAKAICVAPEDCLVIEDSINGVKAAKAAGMCVWGFLGGGHADAGLGARLIAAGATRLFESWPELADALSQTSGRPRLT